MTTVAAHPRYTPDDVLRLENEGLYELVDGPLVEKQTSSLASKTAGIITARLIAFLTPRRGGTVYPEQSFRFFPLDPDLVRRPDIAVVVDARRGGVPGRARPHRA